MNIVKSSPVFTCRGKRFKANREHEGYVCQKPRVTEEENRKYNRIKRRQSRDRMSEEQKIKVREYDRNRHKAKQKILNIQQQENAKSTPMTKGTLKKAAYRARKHLPRSPRKHILLLKKLWERALASPRKRTYIESIGVLGLPSKKKKHDGPKKMFTEGEKVLSKLKSLKKLKSQKKHRQFVSGLLEKYRSMREAGRDLGVRWKVFQKACSAPSNKPDNIADFYVKSGISIELPEKRNVGKRFLTRTVSSAYKEYIKENKDEDRLPSRSTFYRHRPTNCKLVRQMPHRQCICEVCANASLALDALINAGVKTIVRDLRELVKSTLCDPQNMNCIKRNCSTCGVQYLTSQWIEMVGPEKKVTWKRWVFIDKGQNKRKLVPTTVSGTGAKFIKMFQDDLKDLALHLMNADWHYNQFTKLISDVPERVLVEVLDFGRNYLCKYQDEPQGCYWDHSQVTIHPVVCYYRGASGTVTEELIFVSDDRKHDHVIVKKFEAAVENHFAKKNLIFDNIVQFTDQCPGQYKSKTSFKNISSSKIRKQRIYFGTRHGKGPADGACGRVKRAVDQAVMARQTEAKDAKDFFQFCKNSLEKDNGMFQQHFYWISKFKRPKQISSSDTKGVDNTRKIHHVKSVQPNLVDVRDLACTCLLCLGLCETDSCPNAAKTGSWRRVNLLTGKTIDIDDER
jgi:hypothetical protein